MHAYGLVHMDVKSDNIFLDPDARWDLGEFGSSKEIGATVGSYPEALTPYTLSPTATAIPAMDLVLLCVVIAVELDKKTREALCGSQSRVQERLILQKLNSIRDNNFNEEVVELFETNLKVVQEHLKEN